MAGKNRETMIEGKKTGTRERLKRERHDRIAMAARELFAQHGYDAATLRQVAEQAGLGLGTLFNYISDKRDLIYLVFNREVNLVTDIALASPKAIQTFTEKIVQVVEHHYRLFSREPGLSRILLSEVLQHTPGLHLAEHLAIRDRLIKGFEDLVTSAQQSGEIASKENAAIIARQIFFSYSAALRWWLAESEHPNWRAGLRDFAVILQSQFAGLGLQIKVNAGGGASLPTSLVGTAKRKRTKSSNPVSEHSINKQPMLSQSRT